MKVNIPIEEENYNSNTLPKVVQMGGEIIFNYGICYGVLSGEDLTLLHFSEIHVCVEMADKGDD